MEGKQVGGGGVPIDRGGSGADVVVSKRRDSQKQRTRAALVSAAQRMLAEGRTATSVQEVTQWADVGHGSFYNHFSTKEELFAAAITQALDDWGRLRAMVVEGLDDPAVIFVTSFRMTGRLQRQHPELIRLLLNTGTSILITDRGLRPTAKADLERGILSGRFAVRDSEIGVMVAGGMLLGVLQMLDANPDLDAEVVTDEVARMALLALGMSEAEAAALAHEPLPPMPQLVIAPIGVDDAMRP